MVRCLNDRDDGSDRLLFLNFLESFGRFVRIDRNDSDDRVGEDAVSEQSSSDKFDAEAKSRKKTLKKYNLKQSSRITLWQCCLCGDN